MAVGLQFASSEAGTEGVADACWPPIGRCIRGSNRGEIMPGLSVCEERNRDSMRLNVVSEKSELITFVSVFHLYRLYR